MKASSVDILCPIYNGEKYIDQLIKCLIDQTYDNITIIITDDGSKDNTYEVALQYKEKIEARGYGFILLRQENGGLAAAYNKCLQAVSSEYIYQIDCDDIIVKDAIEKFVSVLDSNPDIGYVRANGWNRYIDEPNRADELLTDLPWNNINIQINENMCIPLLKSEAYIGPPASYMYRRKVLEHIYNDRIIDSSRLGQNYQILLAISYENKCKYIEDPLFYYTIRSDSMEHRVIGKEEEIWRIEESARLIMVALKAAGAPSELGEYYARVRENRLKLQLAYRQCDKKMSRESFKYLKGQGLIDKQSRIEYYTTQYALLRLIRECRRTRKKSRK